MVKMLEIKNLRKTYGHGRLAIHAVNNVSFKLKKGDFVFIIGPSGSGKTTLLDMIGTLSKPTEGKVILDKKDVSRLDKYESAHLRRNKIGFVFQAFNLVPTLNCIDNALLPILPTGKEKEYESKARELLKMVGLGERLEHIPAELSGGEKQRVAIARAMLNDPELVLADELTGEVDSKTGAMLMNYMRKVNKDFGTTFVLITHDMQYIRSTDKVIMMKDGKIEKMKNF